MNIVFMGTPDFAVPSLEALVKAGHNILAVYSQPDKPKGRGHKLQATPVKEYALSQNIEVRQPVTLKDEIVQEQLKELNPDCIIVVAYGKLLPKTVLDIPKKGCINVHGSLLPKYRGAAPIQWAVLNGDKTTGITTMYMGEGMDTGDILLKCETEIGFQETSEQLFDRLKDLGANLLIETLEKLDSITPEKQNEDLATQAPMISKTMSQINWNMDASAIHSQIKGLNSWPSAVTELNGKNLKIHIAKPIDEKGEIGKFFNKNGKLCVYCKDKALELIEVQAEGKKRMTGESYLLGHPLSKEN